MTTMDTRVQYFHLKSCARVVITIETKLYETPAVLAMSCIRLFDRILLAREAVLES